MGTGRSHCGFRLCPSPGAGRRGASGQPSRVSRQCDRRDGYPAVRRSMPDVGTQRSQGRRASQPGQFDDASAQGESRRSGRCLFPVSDRAVRRPTRAPVERSRHGDGDAEQSPVGMLEADVRKGKECDVRCGRRPPARSVAAERFGDRILGVVQKGRPQRRRQLDATRRGEHARARTELEHNPVAGRVRLLRWLLRRRVVRPVAYVRAWESAGLRTAVESVLSFQLDDLSTPDVAQALASLGGHVVGLWRILNHPAGHQGRRVSQPGHPLEQAVLWCQSADRKDGPSRCR